MIRFHIGMGRRLWGIPNDRNSETYVVGFVPGIMGVPESGLAIERQAAPSSTSGLSFAVLFHSEERIGAARKFFIVMIVYNFSDIAVHIVNSPGIGQIGTYQEPKLPQRHHP